VLREQNKLIAQMHKSLDICLTVIAFVSACFLKKYLFPEPFKGLIQGPSYHVVLLMIIIIWYVTLNAFDLYASYRKQSLPQIFLKMVKAVSTGTLVMVLCMYLFKIKDVSRIMIGMFFLLDIGLLTLSKGIVYRMLTRFRQKGFNFRNILIAGSRQRAMDVIDAIGDHLGAGYRVLGCLDLEQNEIGKKVKDNVQIIGTLGDLKKILLDNVVDELIFALPLNKVENAGQYIATAEEMGVPVRILPEWYFHRLIYKPGIASIAFEDFLGIPTVALSTTSPRQGELFIKSIFDYLFAGITCALSLPLFLLIACAIKFSSRGPVFFKQERIGLNGRRFIVYKFRTMLAGADQRRKELEAINEADGPVFKLKRDPRVIPFLGTLLRKTSLDELPQLINVLKGEMSLVGPRPPIPAEVEKYDIWQRRRLSMKPGITCLWQCTTDRNEILFEEWMNMDLKYIDNWSLKLDFKIMLRTALVMLMGEGR